MIITKNGKYLIEINGKNIWVYDLLHKELVRKIKSNFRITSHALSHNEEVLAIGDTRGKII